MRVLKSLVLIFVFLYGIAIALLYALQSRLIFFPGKLAPDFKFQSSTKFEEVFLATKDGERINALFFPNSGDSVILYFHGNAGDLNTWQLVSDDLLTTGYNLMIIDYRGYGKSSGHISEQGFYLDADAAYDYLINKGFAPSNILIYGRSIGSGVAVDLASRAACHGLVLESPYSSMSTLAQEKLPYFFPSLYIRYRFDNIGKIRQVKCPVVFIHGSDDTLIPPAHSRRLFDKFPGKKELVIIPRGGHNDLRSFSEYHAFLANMTRFFED